MSDDDWDADSLNREEERKKEEEEKEKKKAAEAAKWAESKEDPEAIQKKKDAAKKAEEEKRQSEARVKNKNAAFDPDAAFKKRQEQYGGSTTTVKAEDLKGMSQAAKGQILEQQAEKGMIDQLFSGEEVEAAPLVVKLNDQKDYVKFGEQTAKTLYSGAAPYRIENFYKELCKDLKLHCDAQQIKKILDNITLIHKEKDKEERKNRGTGGKKGNQAAEKTAVLKGGGGKGYDRNNNQAMIQDQMGGDEYGDYGDEDGGFRREGEQELDFM